MNIGAGSPRAAELAAQVADVHIDDVRRRVVLVAPDGAQDLLAREHLPAVAQQVDQQLELGRRQLHRRAAAAHLAGEQVDLDVPHPQRRWRRPARATRSCARTRATQLGQRERLDQVVHSARVEPGDAIVDLAARGQHDHRHAPAWLGAPRRGSQDQRDRAASGRARSRRSCRSSASRSPSTPSCAACTSKPSASRPRRTKSTMPGSSSISSTLRVGHTTRIGPAVQAFSDSSDSMQLSHQPVISSLARRHTLVACRSTSMRFPASAATESLARRAETSRLMIEHLQASRRHPPGLAERLTAGGTTGNERLTAATGSSCWSCSPSSASPSSALAISCSGCICSWACC